MNKANTSYVERQNLSMRMGMRRFTRLTNGFSKKVEKQLAILSLYFAHYNWYGIHKTLRVTPAMEARLAHKPRGCEWIVALIGARAPKPGPRGPYKKRDRASNSN